MCQILKQLVQERDAASGWCTCAIFSALSPLLVAWVPRAGGTAYQHGEHREAEADVSSRAEGEENLAVSAKMQESGEQKSGNERQR